MRTPTQREVDGWLELAREHGHIGDAGTVALGRYVVEAVDGPRAVRVRFVTPVPAGLYTEDLSLKRPPIMFDRTSDGGIILPGRWWQLTLQKVSEDERVPADLRRNAAHLAHVAQFSDTVVPVETDTISFLAPNDAGELVQHEALAPGTVVTMQFALPSDAA